MSERTKSAYSYATITPNDIAHLTHRLYPCNVEKITDYRFTPFSKEILGYLGIHELLTIDVLLRDNDESRSITFFVKSVLPRCNEFQRVAYRVEVTFFRDVVPRMAMSEQWSAKCYLAKTDMLFMENLKPKGYKVTKGLFNLNQLRALMSCLARFHASSLLLEAELKKPLNEAYPGCFKEKVFLRDDPESWQWTKMGIEVVEIVAESLELDPAYAKRSYEMMLEENELSTDELNVLAHCDLWCENVMFGENDTQCRLVDFQMLTYKCYAVDLVQALHLNTKPSARRRLEKELIGVYHGALRETLIKHDYEGRIVTLDEVYETVERKRLCGLVAAIQFCPVALGDDDELTHEYTKDAKRKDYVCTSRKIFVTKALKVDKEYRFRIEQAVKDLVGYMRRSERESV